MNKRNSIHFINEAINQGAELRSCIYCSPCIMNVRETTEQLLPPVNTLNNSGKNLRLTFHLFIPFPNIRVSIFTRTVSKLCSSLLRLTIYIPKYWMKTACGLGKLFLAGFPEIPLKFLIKRGLSATLGTVAPLCDTFVVPCPITLTERAQETFLAPDEQLWGWTFNSEFWKLPFNDFSVPIRQTVSREADPACAPDLQPSTFP